MLWARKGADIVMLYTVHMFGKKTDIDAGQYRLDCRRAGCASVDPIKSKEVLSSVVGARVQTS